MIRRLFRLWPDPRLLLRLGALQAVQAVLQGLLLGTLVPILRAVLRPEPAVGDAAPWLVVGGIGLVVSWVLSAVATPVGFAASTELAAHLRRRLIAHVATLPLGWFTTGHKGALARGVTTDVGNIATVAITIGLPAITSSLVPATTVLVALAVDVRMGLVLLAVVPVAVLTLRWAGRVAAEADLRLEEANTEIAGRAIEVGQAQPVLRAAGLGSTGTPAMQAALADHRTAYRTGLQRASRPDLAFTAVVMLGFVAALATGTGLLLDDTVSVASAVALLIIAVRFLEPLASLIELIGALRAMDNAIGRVSGLLATPTLPAPVQPVTRLGPATVELDGVGFAYGLGERPALAGVDLVARPGTTTALVGPSGSGKTTVTRLIARFFDVDTGAVRVGGVDVRQIEPSVLLDAVAVVFQDVYLFDDTIEANLRMARPDATRAELDAAARAARLDEVLARLPSGWSTPVGEGGAQLSGGERQRVSIARALLKGSPVVLVDEAASALDPENERAVAEALAELGRDPGRTLLVIAHRPGTIAAADQVVVLDQGRVVETGPPEVLAAGDGSFPRLVRQYEQARSWHLAPTAGEAS